eukprot:CAMPEP_0169097904 /NCGR_PEP_ID=MMETSP1015-20121227/19759_1 /TAXON_ID=342587 /ORGANISM="Karlodinium micrum, Strain CCMP2283" /LENGTH=682 /DNA_ID=CAMNT_0009158723 /DNA_START=82 /DNA_END=2127 /DNA_ORIENTATION=-
MALVSLAGLNLEQAGILSKTEASSLYMETLGLHVFDPSWKSGNTYHSATFREIELQIYGTDEVFRLPAQTCTKAGDVRAVIASECMVPEENIVLIAKKGCYVRKLQDIDEMLSHVMVKGIKSFKPQPHKWKHPFGVIGAGYNGIKSALYLATVGCDSGFCMFDRYDRVGGTAWLVQANKTSKLQTDFAAFHVWFGPEWGENNKTLSYPTDWSSWPKKDEVLAHLDHAMERYALYAHCSLKTDVREIKLVGKKDDMDRYYQLSVKDLKTNKDREMSVQCVMHYPGAYFTPRQIIYPGEETFGGAMGYGMADDIPYDHIGGNRVAILGNGAFAVENIRTCMEYGCAKVYQVCRRKNLASPRMVCWFVHQGITPVPAWMLLNCCKSMYDVSNFGDPWSFHSVYGSKEKEACTISSNSRFGIGDVTFLACATGRCEYVVDTVKRFQENTVHLNGGGKLDDIKVVIKALGLLADFNCDKLHNIKEMIGLYPSGDHRRMIYCDALGMHANNFTTKSTGGPSLTNNVTGKYFMDFPKEYMRAYDTVKGILPVSTADENKPACQYTAQYAMSANGILMSCVPKLGALSDHNDYMHKVVTACYPLDKYYEECVNSWNQYQAEWNADGFEHPYIPYPYTRQEIDAWFTEYEQKVGPLRLEDKGKWWARRADFVRKTAQGDTTAKKAEAQAWW